MDSIKASIYSCYAADFFKGGFTVKKSVQFITIVPWKTIRKTIKSTLLSVKNTFLNCYWHHKTCMDLRRNFLIEKHAIVETVQINIAFFKTVQQIVAFYANWKRILKNKKSLERNIRFPINNTYFFVNTIITFHSSP